jgi:hypothetical protein
MLALKSIQKRAKIWLSKEEGLINAKFFVFKVYSEVLKLP